MPVDRFQYSVLKKIKMQCEDCDSTDILMLGASMKWNYDKQEWDYYDSSGGYTYMCQDNYHENVDVIEREEGE